jgi:cysteine-S-conjugate beta-lyase
MSRSAADPPGDAPSAVRNSLDSLSLAELRLRRSEKWRDVDPDVLPVWVAEMDFPLAEPVRNTLLEMVARGDTGYPTRTRLPETYAEFAVGRYGFDVDPSRISIVLDVMRGVYLALQLCTLAGDGVVVSPPVYPPFFSTIRFAGRHIVEAPLARDSDSGQWELDLDALERAFALGARAFLLCSPHNPVGRSWSIGELQAVAVLADRYGVVVLADEVHAPLTYPEAQHVPFATLDSPAARRGVTFVSASKAWNLPGLKCAMAIAASKEMSDAFDRLPDEVREEPGILGIAANEAAFRDGRAWLEDVIRYLDVNRRSLREQLEQRLPAVRMVPPQATYLAWLDCRDLGLGEDPAAVFLDRGRVALSPGTKFGTGGRCFARFNFATSRAIVREAVERMSRAIG